MAFNGRFVLNIAHYASRLGVDLDRLVELSGHSMAYLEKEDATIQNQAYNSVIETAVAESCDPFFGLHVGESQNLSAVGLILQISQSSETVKQALHYCCEFANLGCSALPLTLVEEQNHYKVRMKADSLWLEQSPIAVRHTAEGVLCFSIREFHSLTREKHQAIAVHLPWKRPKDDISEYSRILGCPVLFNQAEIALLLQKKHVEDKVITSDHALLQILVAHAHAKSAQIEQLSGFSAAVKQSVISLIKPAFPSIEQVAHHLNLSLRTLQRRLKEEGYTFKKLIDELRKDFAFSYLKRPDLSITEIAFLLDYADTSAFSRSFKRWTGQSPISYRSGLPQ